MRHFAPISGIATWNESYVATAGYDNQLILWDAKQRQPLQRVFHDHLANQCAFSPDGGFLVSASSDCSARIWAMPTLRLVAALVGHSDDVEMAIFRPDGKRVATCSRDHTVRVFDLSGRCMHILEGHTADVISICWSAGGRELVSSSDDGTIRRWDAERGVHVESIDLTGVETDTVAVASDGTLFAGDDEGELTILDVYGRRSLQAHAAGIKRVVWDDEQRRLVSLSYDRSVILWQYTGGRLEQITKSSLPSIVWPRSCAFLGLDRIAFATFGTCYAEWNHRSDEWHLNDIESAISLNAVVVHHEQVYSIGDGGTLAIDGQPGTRIGSLCNFLLPLGEHVLTGGQMGRLYDAVTGKSLHQHRSPLNCGAVFRKDGIAYAAIGTYTGEALIFRTNERGGVEHVADVRLHDNAIKGLAADEKYLFSVCASAAAAFHRISDFSLDKHVPHAHTRIANGCAAVDGGFASVGRDLKLRLWLAGKEEVFDSPHHHSIKCIGVSPDRGLIATGSYGGSIALFDVKNRRWTQQRRPTSSGISCITYVPELGNFIASSYDGHLYVVGAGGRYAF